MFDEIEIDDAVSRRMQSTLWLEESDRSRSKRQAMIGFLTSQVGPSHTLLDEPPHSGERTEERK